MHVGLKLLKIQIVFCLKAGSIFESDNKKKENIESWKLF